MRKLLSALLIAAILLSSATALAEGNRDKTPKNLPYREKPVNTAPPAANVYEGELYRFACPDGWIVLDEESIDSIFEEILDGSLPGIDTSTIAEYATQIEETGMEILMSEDGLMNANFAAQNVGVHLTTEDLLSMAPDLLIGYDDMFPGFEVIDAGSIATFGENEYVRLIISMETMGTKVVITQLLCGRGSNLGLITLTATQDENARPGAADKALGEIAASFYIK